MTMRANVWIDEGYQTVEIHNPRRLGERRVGWVREGEPIILRDWICEVEVEGSMVPAAASVDHDRIPRTWDTEFDLDGTSYAL